MSEQWTPDDSIAAASDFLRVYMLMPNDADIEVSCGMLDGGEPILIVEAKHSEWQTAGIALTMESARHMADALEQTMHEHRLGAVIFPNLILALRQGAAVLEPRQ